MRRSLARLPSCTIPIGSGLRQSAFSTSSSGRGRGGRGFPNEFSVTPPPNPADPTDQLQPPPQPQPQPLPLGHGRGKPLTSFSAFVNNQPQSSSAGRGRGRVRGSGPAPPQPSSRLVAHDFTPSPPPPPPPQPTSHKPEEPNLPSSIVSVLSGAGRGKPVKPAESSPDRPKQQENRHIRSPRQQQRTSSAGATTPSPQPQRLSREEAIKKAVGILSAGDDQSDSAGGRSGGRGGFRSRGGRGRGIYGRGRRGGRGEGRAEVRHDDYATGLYLGDNADGEKLAKRLGADVMNKLVEGFEEMSSTVLPSPVDDLYLDALHTNLMIECEPEYLMGEFDQNPDIEEKPPISLRDALEKMKPFLMAYEGIQNQQEWEEVVEETMERVPLIKAIVDHYSGPDRVTAKQQQEELERVAKTLPETAPSSVKRFTDRAILSLQSNPGWGFDKKCQFMDKLVWEVSQQYK